MSSLAGGAVKHVWNNWVIKARLNWVKKEGGGVVKVNKSKIQINYVRICPKEQFLLYSHRHLMEPNALFGYQMNLMKGA